jgi:hypothetical protein
LEGIIGVMTNPADPRGRLSCRESLARGRIARQLFDAASSSARIVTIPNLSPQTSLQGSISPMRSDGMQGRTRTAGLAPGAAARPGAKGSELLPPGRLIATTNEEQ